MRDFVVPLIIVIALAALLAGSGCARQEPPARTAPAPVDSDVPERLSTATFGLG
jgi:hypothetical protein